MKILIVTSSYNLGGAERHAFNLAKFFKSKNIEVLFMVFEKGDESLLKLCNENNISSFVTTQFISFKSFPTYILQIFHYRKMVNELNVDVIISFNFRNNIWNGVISKFSKVKCSVWSQQGVFKERWNLKFSKLAFKWVSVFISNAYHVSQKLYEQQPCKRVNEAFRVVHNGIVEQKPMHDVSYWKKRLNLDEYNFIAAMVANISKTKDHDTLLKAWKIFISKKKSGLCPVLLLVGREDNNTANVKNLINRLNINDYVILTGKINDIPGINSVIDLGILSSNEEGLPNSIMEQMKLGLPVVGTSNDGIKEAVGSAMHQYLNNKNDALGLANNIELFAYNKLLRKEVGNKNKIRIDENFIYNQMGEQTLNVIYDCINK